MPDTSLIILHISFHINLTVLLQGSCYHPHFSQGESKALIAETAYDVRSQCLQVPDESPDVSVCKFVLFFQRNMDNEYTLRLSLLKYVLHDVKRSDKVGYFL